MLEHSQIKEGDKYCYVIVLPDIQSLIISYVKYKIVNINRVIGLLKMEYRSSELWKYVGSAKEMYWFETQNELREFVALEKFSLYERSYLVADTMTSDIVAVEEE